MIYLTGDTHRNFKRVKEFSQKHNTTKKDTMIILGDAGINYLLNEGDREFKNYLQNIQIAFLCIHGNHEARPSSISSYTKTTWNSGKVYLEYDFPSIMFAKDGEIYNINDKQVIAIGGAYSVDKFYRLQNGLRWFEDEQPSNRIKRQVESRLDSVDWKVDIVLSHTCPYKYMPHEWFMKGINQSRVDNSTEKWLDTIEDKLDYEKWYCGHFHGDKTIDKMRFMGKDFVELRW